MCSHAETICETEMGCVTVAKSRNTKGDLVMEILLKVSETAGQLQVAEKTVWAYIYAGTLPVVRIGRNVRIKQSTLDRLIAEGESKPARTPRKVVKPVTVSQVAPAPFSGWVTGSEAIASLNAGDVRE
jgi:excisionase family DNA binding protein